MIRRIVINRLWHGFASIRDYQAKESFEDKTSLLIVLKGSGEEMLIPWNKIPLMIMKVSKDKFKSIHEEGKEYHLIDFKFVPTTKQKKLL